MTTSERESCSLKCAALRSTWQTIINNIKSGLSVTKAALEAFSALPRAAEQLKEDFSLLEERAAAAGVEPLKKWIDDLGGNLVILADDLQAHGFGDRSIRETKELFDLFLRAIEATQSTKASDLP